MKFTKIVSLFAMALCLLLVIVSAGCTDSGSSTAPVEEGVTVLAATSLTNAMNDVISAFEKQNPNVKVTPSYGGSNSLVTQMTTGAVDADVFMSADVANMKKIIDAKLADDYSVLLNNKLIIVTGKDNPKNITGIGDLIREGIEIASGIDGVPFASYGTGVAEKFETDGNAGFAEKYAKHIAYKGDNVAAARTQVAIGEADATIIYATDFNGFSDKLDRIEIPEKYNTVTELPFAVLAESKEKAGTKAFAKFLQSDEAKNIFKSHGFSIAA